MELNDLNENYKNVIKEKERLKQNLQIFIDENKAAAKHIKMIENSLQNYEQNAENLMKEKDSLINQLENAQKYNDKLSDELALTKAQIETLTQNQMSYQQNSKIDNDININNQTYINALNKQIARLQMEKKNLIEKLNQNQNQNLEEIIANERQKNFDSNKIIQQLQDELNQKMNFEGDNANVLKELQNENNELKSQINLLKNENMILQSQKNLVGSNDSQTFPRSLNNTLLRNNQFV